MPDYLSAISIGAIFRENSLINKVKKAREKHQIEESIYLQRRREKKTIQKKQ